MIDSHLTILTCARASSTRREKPSRSSSERWKSFYMQLHVGRAITNFYRAEHDPLSNEILVAEGYDIKKGAATLPQEPGAGISINESKFSSDATIRFDVSA